MLKKISLPVMVTVMCIMIALVLGLVFVNKTGKLLTKKRANQTEEKEVINVKRTDYSATARKTLDWIDKQRNESGWYILERGCDFEKKTCDTVWDNAEGNKDGLVATWARLNYYEQKKDSKDLDIVKKDIDFFYNKYKEGLSDSLWICKITYEMAQSKYLDSATKTKLEEICFNSDFPTPQDVSEYWKTGKNKKIVALGEGKDFWKTWDGYTLTLRGFDASVAYASDMVYRYLWKKDNANLDLAKEYLKVIRDVYENETVGAFKTKAIKYTDDVCLIGLANLDVYKFGSKEKEYLEYAEKIYSNLAESSEGKEKFETAICGLMVKNLYQITNDKKYLSDLEINNQILTISKLDGKTNKFLSDFGFFLTSNKNKGAFFKSVVDNGLMVEMVRN